MVWMGNNLITVGTRHIKVWRIDDDQNLSPSKQRFNLDGAPLLLPTPTIGVKTLAGRNCLLGALVEATFTCVAAISDQMAVVCSERGDVCLLDDTDGQRLLKVGHSGFGVTCIAVDTERDLVCVGGKVGLTKYLTFQELIQARNSPEPWIDQDQTVLNGDAGSSTLCAMAFVDGLKVTVDSQHSIKISTTDVVLQEQNSRPLTAHRDPVLGVRLLQQPNEMEADFFTWSSTGEVHFWDLQGHSQGSLQVEVEQLAGDDESANQCQVIRASESTNFLVTGDKYGVLRFIDCSTRKSIFSTKAHGSEILDIAIHEGDNATLVASCGRDRTVQLFRKITDWTLVQTMDEHTASVSGLLFCEGGEKLVSCSADRTIQIRQVASREVNSQEVMAAVPIKVITLKASPLSMVLSSHNQATSLVVSLLDRTVASYDITSGKLLSSFRATDGDGNEAVVMDGLTMGKSASILGRPTILAGVSSTDKSVRLYDGSTGAFVDREWGHTASITGVALLETSAPEQTTVISTGADGTIMIWDLIPRTEREDLIDQNGSSSPPKEVTSARPPLRRVLSKAELAEFSRPSPSSTPTGRTSPPRPLRRKTSRYAMSTQSPKLALPPIPSMPSKYNMTDASDADSRRGSPRNRSRTPPPSPKSKQVTRRPSLASLDIRGRTRSTGNSSEFGTLNMSTEQVCRTLRAYRKKLGTTESINESLLKELDQELRLTAKALGEKTLKTKALSETVLAGLLDQYSDRLVSIFDEKLRLSLSPATQTEAGASGRLE
jgi:WD40 repeat protein